VPTVAEISVQSTQDPNVKAYHTRYEMSSGHEAGVRGSSDELGEFGLLMLEIRGVTQVHVMPYLLLITKGQMFEWDEISPKVEDILKGFAKSQRLLLDDAAGQVVGIEKSGSVGISVPAKTDPAARAGKTSRNRA
jgi:hypothetical protein